MINLSAHKEGETILISDHFSNKRGFYSDLFSNGLNGNNWDVAEALKNLGVNEDTAIMYATNPKSIPNDLKTAINQKIKPKEGTIRFTIKNIESVKGSSKKVPHYDEKDFVKAIERLGFTKELYFEENEKYIFNPVPSSLIKGVGYIGTGKDAKSRAWKNFRKHGVYGSVGKEFTYFTPDLELALSHAPYEDAQLIELNIPSLAKYREVFFDPESSYIASEKAKTLVVMGGVPKEAITKIYHMSKV